MEPVSHASPPATPTPDLSFLQPTPSGTGPLSPPGAAGLGAPAALDPNTVAMYLAQQQVLAQQRMHQVQHMQHMQHMQTRTAQLQAMGMLPFMADPTAFTAGLPSPADGAQASGELDPNVLALAAVLLAAAGQNPVAPVQQPYPAVPHFVAQAPPAAPAAEPKTEPRKLSPPGPEPEPLPFPTYHAVTPLGPQPQGPPSMEHSRCSDPARSACSGDSDQAPRPTDPVAGPASPGTAGAIEKPPRRAAPPDSNACSTTSDGGVRKRRRSTKSSSGTGEYQFYCDPEYLARQPAMELGDIPMIPVTDMQSWSRLLFKPKAVLADVFTTLAVIRQHPNLQAATAPQLAAQMAAAANAPDSPSALPQDATAATQLPTAPPTPALQRVQPRSMDPSQMDPFPTHADPTPLPHDDHGLNVNAKPWSVPTGPASHATTPGSPSPLQRTPQPLAAFALPMTPGALSPGAASPLADGAERLVRAEPPADDVLPSLAHTALAGRVEYVPHDEAAVAAVKWDPAVPKKNDLPPEHHSLFVGHARFETHAREMAFIIERTAGVRPSRVVSHGRGCCTVQFKDTGDLVPVRGLHHRLLFDNVGVWFARTPVQHRHLMAYAETELGSLAKCNLPRGCVTVESSLPSGARRGRKKDDGDETDTPTAHSPRPLRE